MSPKPIFFLLFSMFMLMPLASLAGVWKYEKMIDDFTDEVKSAAYHRVEGLKGISVHCFSGSKNIQVSVFLDNYLNNRFEPVHVKYRFDSGPVVETTWTVGGGENMVWDDDSSAVRFARFLQTSKKLVFEATAYDYDSHRIHVDLSDSGEPIQKVLNDCGK